MLYQIGFYDFEYMGKKSVENPIILDGADGAMYLIYHLSDGSKVDENGIKS